MKSRKDTIKKNRTSKKLKLLIGTLFLSVGIFSSITVAFADQDIEGLLVNWFSNQKVKSVDSIESAIMSEKEVQMKRLKEELQIEMNNAQKQLDQFTEEQKVQRINALRAHADELIKNFNVDNSKNKEDIINKLNKILDDAIDKMNKVGKNNKENEGKSTVTEGNQSFEDTGEN